MKEVRCEQLAKWLFEEREKSPQIDFYGDYDNKTGEGIDIYRIAVMNFADSVMVIANYYGGGCHFCRDMTDDADYKELFFALSTYLTHYLGIYEGVVFVDESDYKNFDSMFPIGK